MKVAEKKKIYETILNHLQTPQSTHDLCEKMAMKSTKVTNYVKYLVKESKVIKIDYNNKTGFIWANAEANPTLKPYDSPQHQKHWSQEEDYKLIEAYNRGGFTEAARSFPERSHKGVRMRMFRLGIHSKSDFSELDQKLIAVCKTTRSIDELEMLLDIPSEMVNHRLRYLKRRGKIGKALVGCQLLWQDVTYILNGEVSDEIKRLRNALIESIATEAKSCAEIAKGLGKSTSAIIYHLNEMESAEQIHKSFVKINVYSHKINYWLAGPSPESKESSEAVRKMDSDNDAWWEQLQVWAKERKESGRSMLQPMDHEIDDDEPDEEPIEIEEDRKLAQLVAEANANRRLVEQQIHQQVLDLCTKPLSGREIAKALKIALHRLVHTFKNLRDSGQLVYCGSTLCKNKTGIWVNAKYFTQEMLIKPLGVKAEIIKALKKKRFTCRELVDELKSDHKTIYSALMSLQYEQNAYSQPYYCSIRKQWTNIWDTKPFIIHSYHKPYASESRCSP
jgi:hypothetical protein